MIFTSRKDKFYPLIFSGHLVFILLLSYLYLSGSGSWPYLFLFILLICIASLLASYFATRYKICEDYLTIRSGLYRKKISISDIKRIEQASVSKTASTVAGPAQSIKRTNIYYDDDYDLMSISPENVKGFIEELKMRNPSIEIT